MILNDFEAEKEKNSYKSEEIQSCDINCIF